MHLPVSGLTKARKDYVCTFCKKPIPKGSLYNRVWIGGSNLMNGTFCDFTCEGQHDWKTDKPQDTLVDLSSEGTAQYRRKL